MLIRSPAIIASIFTLCLCANQELAAQPFRGGMFRGGMHPFWGRFNTASQFSVGPYVRSATGNYSISTGAFDPSATGPYTLISRRGFFSPQQSTFVPSRFGPYTLATRESFDPKSGQLVPSATGPFLAASRGFLSPNGQQPSTLVRGTRGDFSPSTGAFNPLGTGASTLITPRGVFTPTSGNFTPSVGGPFVLRTREALDPKTNSLVPSATGPFVVSSRGDFNSSTAGAAFVPLNSFGSRGMAGYHHYNALLQNAYQNGNRGTYGGFGPGSSNYSSMAYYPYGGSGYGSSGAAYSPLNYQIPPVSYTFASYGGNSNYGGNNGYNYGYGGGYNASPYSANQDDTYSGETPYQAPGAIPPYRPQTAKPKQENIPLAALGVPTEDGKVRWPLAFRVMSPTQKEEILDKLEAQLKIIAAQVVSGNASPVAVKLAKQNVAKLHESARSRRINMAEGTFNEAETFLRKLDDALQSVTN